MSIDAVPISQSGAFGSDPAWGRDFSPTPLMIFSKLQTQVYPLLASIQNGIEALAPFVRAGFKKRPDGSNEKNSLTGLPYRYVDLTMDGKPQSPFPPTKSDLSIYISETQIDIHVLRAIGELYKPAISEILRQSDARDSIPGPELSAFIDMVDKYEALTEQIVDIENTQLQESRPLIKGKEVSLIRFINDPKYTCETPHIHRDKETTVLTLANKPELATHFFGGLPNKPVDNPNYQLGKAEVGLFAGGDVTHSKPEIPANRPMHRIGVIGTFSRAY